jgi:hypothetical protein
VASADVIIGISMDRGVNWSGGNDGALMIVSHRWNANLVILPRQAPVHNPYYSALLFYACALSLKELNETHLYIYIYIYPISLTSMIGSCSVLCYMILVEAE